MVKKIVYITVQAPYGRGETFIIDEMLAMEETGADLLIVPRNPTKEIFHQEARTLLPNAIWLPLINFRMIHTFFVSLITKPRLLKVLLFIICNSRTLKILIKNLIVIPKGVFIANLLQEKEIDHIHAHWGSTTATMAYVISCLSDIHWSLTLHRWDIKENNMLRGKVKTAKFVRCISQCGKNELTEITGRKYQEKIKVIHMGVKVPANIKEPSGNRKIFTIVTPANLLEVKGHKYLIEACSILAKQSATNFQCIFYGEGPLRVKLENLIKKKSLTNYVKMPGAIFHERLIEMYKNRKVDTVVLSSINTSKGEHEGIPVSLMEAMAYKIPTISTNTGGILELLSDGAGIVVEEQNSEQLASAISILLKNQELRYKIGMKGCRRVVEEFNVSTSAARLLGAIKG